MNSWECFKKSIPSYMKNSKGYSFIEEDGITITKTGIDHYSCNFMTIDSANPSSQKDQAKKHFTGSGIIFSSPHAHNSVKMWAPSYGFNYLGQAPLMKAANISDKKDFLLPQGIDIVRVSDKKSMMDYIEVFSDTRGISFKSGESFFSKFNLEEGYILYVGYENGRPSGIFCAIVVEDSVIIADADVKKESQNSGLLKSMSYVANNNAKLDNLSNFNVLVTSKYAYKVLQEYGFSINSYCDIWKRAE